MTDLFLLLVFIMVCSTDKSRFYLCVNHLQRSSNIQHDLYSNTEIHRNMIRSEMKDSFLFLILLKIMKIFKSQHFFSNEVPLKQSSSNISKIMYFLTIKEQSLRFRSKRSDFKADLLLLNLRLWFLNISIKYQFTTMSTILPGLVSGTLL